MLILLSRVIKIMMWNGDVTDGHDEDHNVYNLITKYLDQGDQETGGRPRVNQ